MYCAQSLSSSTIPFLILLKKAQGGTTSCKRCSSQATSHTSLAECASFLHSPAGLLAPSSPSSLSVSFCLSFGSNVFQNYTWERTNGEYSWFGNNLIPARVPLTALLSGMLLPFPRSHLRIRSFLLCQVLLPGIHFRPPSMPCPQSPSTSSRKYAQTLPSSIPVRSVPGYGIILLRMWSRQSWTSLSGRKIGVWRSRPMQGRSSILCASLFALALHLFPHSTRWFNLLTSWRGAKGYLASRADSSTYGLRTLNLQS